jgi:hypothetical protein
MHLLLRAVCREGKGRPSYVNKHTLEKAKASGVSLPSCGLKRNTVFSISNTIWRRAKGRSQLDMRAACIVTILDPMGPNC